jgi:transposase
MLSLSPAIRIFLCAEPAGLRKSFDGLSALVRQALGDDPLSGHWFVSRNRKGDRLKILTWSATHPAHRRRIPDPRCFLGGRCNRPVCWVR